MGIFLQKLGDDEGISSSRKNTFFSGHDKLVCATSEKALDVEERGRRSWVDCARESQASKS